jgi:hypothetical protein
MDMADVETPVIDNGNRAASSGALLLNRGG